MRNIIKIIICISIILLILCYICNPINAITTGTVYLQSNKNVFEQGEEIEIAVFIKDAKTVSFETSLYFDNSKLEYISELENANIVDNNHILFVWYDETGGRNARDGELVKFKFRAKEKGTAIFNIEGEFYDETKELIQADFKDVQVQIGREEKEDERQKNQEQEQMSDEKTDSATLQVLRIDREGIVPSFNKDIYDYYLTVSNDVGHIDILAISENPNATIEIVGNNNLKNGLNNITIKVISEDKTQSKVYTIQVTKTNDVELANTNLEILAIENVFLNPPFDTNITHYNIEVSNDTSSLNIFAVPQNENATVEIIGKDDIEEGDNIINVIVTGQNGFSKRTYEIKCHKRNKAEQDKYEKEERENVEKLEQIYETQKINEFVESEKSNIFRVVLITILLVASISLIALYWGKHLKK